MMNLSRCNSSIKKSLFKKYSINLKFMISYFRQYNRNPCSEKLKKKKDVHTYPSMRISSWIEKVKRFVKLRLFISSCTDNFKLCRKTSKWWARTLQSANKIAYQDREFVVDILFLFITIKMIFVFIS